ncbi:MAG: rhodanese-like domain-containing protein [Verrucomicrobia bacterium]|nr:rhodanese-like domain-containing protein [Verrucomicrobiota bacterium]
MKDPFPTRPLLSVIGRDFLGFLVLCGISLLAGLLINALREKPLPLVYQPPLERIRKSLAARSQPGAEMAEPAPSWTGGKKGAGAEMVGKKGTGAAVPRPHTAGNAQSSSREISPQDLRMAMGKPGLVVLDARPRDFYELKHIAGARNLSRERLEEDFNRLYPVLSDPSVKQIVVYCANATCEDSRIVAAALSELGFGPMFVLKDGWAEWEAAGLPVERQ